MCIEPPMPPLMPVGTAEQFRHDFARRRAAHQRMRVFAVIADDVVRRAGRVDHAGGDRFFAGIEMQKADDIAFGVFLRRALLEGATSNISRSMRCRVSRSMGALRSIGSSSLKRWCERAGPQSPARCAQQQPRKRPLLTAYRAS